MDKNKRRFSLLNNIKKRKYMFVSLL